MENEFKKKHWTIYKAFDQSMKYKLEKARIVSAYNATFGTGYKYISEFVHCSYGLGIRVPEIAFTLEVTVNAIYTMLENINVRCRNKSGREGVDINGIDVNAIRASKDTRKALAEKHKVSIQTIGNIIRMQGKWRCK